MSKLRDKLSAGEFAITSEIGPPKGTDITQMMHEADAVKDKVDAYNVTDLQSSVMRLGSLAVCSLLLQKGLEPVFQVTCRDRNRLALQSDLISAAVLGIENVLALTGDHPSLGDHKDAKPVFDLDSTTLLLAIKLLQSGKDLSGAELKGSPKFFTGAVVNPCADPLEPELVKMERKIDAGVQFFQTQAIYDIKRYENFLKHTKHIKVPIMGGIVLLKSAGMAKYMNKNVAGVYVPDALIKEMQETKDKKATCIDISARIVKEIKPMCQGIHFMPLGWDTLVGDIIDKSGL